MTSIAHDTTTQRRPATTALLGGDAPMDHGVAAERLRKAQAFVLSTTRSDGRPHAVPLLAVYVDGALHFATGDATQKARDLAANPACVMTTSGDGSDLVVEGHAARVGDEHTVRRVADAYRSKYGWDPEPRDGELHAEGAPTAGTP